MWFSYQLHNIRFYILTFNLLVILSILLIVFSSQDLSLIQGFMIPLFAFLALGHLYIALLASPLLSLFPRLPFSANYLKARRAIGVSAFSYGLSHGLLSFIYNVGGFSGLALFEGKFLLAVLFGVFALTILAIMAATSFDLIIRKFGFSRWKLLHRLVYLASMGIVAHAVILGRHFYDLTSPIPVISFLLLALLLLLESIRIEKYLQKLMPQFPRIGIVPLLVLGLLLFGYWNLAF